MSFNEAKTEFAVKEHFDKFKDQIVFEGKKSDNIKIQKLLATASKKGEGKGFPDFIIQLKNNSNLIVVIECKPDISKHESFTLDKYVEYAVDGVLLYSSYLSKDFDVLAIAISGEDQSKLKISHFLQLQGEKKAVPQFGNKLLSISDYLEGYNKSPEKFRQDYNKLLSFSKDLNDKLHGYKIVESDRGLLISCILIALENDSFKQTYKNFDYRKPEAISNFLVGTVEREFDKAVDELAENKKLEQKAKYNLVTDRFGFIKTDTSLSTKFVENRANTPILTDIIEDIELNVQDFIRTHEYFDVLGQLYIEFLRYANSDKGLGIVLTPPHITEFMAELAEVNKDSVVYDNCTGTGGFLVSAMNLMVADAKGDQEKIKNIKQKQLIGVEFQAHIFALACSNMFIHQDGKSNILKGSCFDKDIIEEVKNIKPNVGLLNPPYRSKSTDTHEFEFILNNLDCLEQGGKCVAIVPMQLSVAKKGVDLEWKRKILENHTLEAVFSMPDELFLNSKVSVVSCIMVFTAKRKHPEGKECYFGYYKEDGFCKRKYRGRVDLNKGFETIYKKKWVNSFINKKNIPGLSVNKEISVTTEWCAEAYMETDYSLLTEQDFIQTIKNYLSYQLVNFDKKINIDKNSKLSNSLIELGSSHWKYFDYKSVFKIKKGKRLTTYDQEAGEIPYISSSSLNNGLDNLIDNGVTDENCLSFACYGSIGYVFYQEKPCWISDNCNVIYLNDKTFNTYLGMFLSTIISLERFRFSYGMTGKSERLRKFKIKLPATKEGEPNWQFMEDYIKSLPYSANL